MRPVVQLPRNFSKTVSVRAVVLEVVEGLLGQAAVGVRGRDVERLRVLSVHAQAQAVAGAGEER